MATQASDFGVPAGEGIEAASQSETIKPGCPEAQTDANCGSFSRGDLVFEGIAHDEVKMMMKQMRCLVDAPRMRRDTFPVESIRLRCRTLMVQADVAESDFESLGSVRCIEQAVKCRSRLLLLTPAWHEEWLDCLKRLGSALQQKFMCLGDIADLNRAVECFSQAVLLTPDGHPDKPSRHNNFGVSYQSRFERLGELADLDRAIQCFSQAVLLTPDGHPNKPSGHNNLGISYRSRFQRLGELADLDRAIQCFSQAVLLTPDGHPDKPSGHNNLGIAYQSQFQRLGELADLDRAIECLSQAVLLTPDGHPDKPSRHNNFGVSYQSRFEWLGELADLDRAIQCFSQAVLLTPDGHPDKPSQHNNLGVSYQSRFERLGELADLDRAIQFKSQAVLLTADGHPNNPSWHNNLGNSYQSRFEWLGELADLNRAIECLSRAVLLTPDSHPDKPSQHNNLGNSYQSRFQRLGELADLDRAMECFSQAVLLTPDGHPNKPPGHNYLGNSYQSRFERLGELADLDRAVECFSQAVLLTPDGHPNKPSGHNSLGNSYQSRFERLGELADLNRAIQCFSQAVLLTPDGHPNKPSGHNNLGISYRSRFQRLGELADLDRAIECLSQAVLLTPDSHPDKPSRHNNLGISYQSRFERLGELADLDRAIQCLSQAVLLTPDGHPNKPSQHHNLGISYQSRFDFAGTMSDLEHAQLHFQRGAQLQVLAPASQVICARKWATVSSLLGLSPEPAYNRCMQLVPHLIWLGTPINQRYTLVPQINDLATEAAAWAISVQLYHLAIEWLEEGRSILWHQILQFRTPFDDLSTIDPGLAQRLTEIASHLESAGWREGAEVSSTDAARDLEIEAQHYRRLATEWEQRLEEARTIPGFQRFMRPRKASELRRAAKDGPVILINTHSTRWDALVILPQCDNVAHVPLVQLPLHGSSKSLVQLLGSVAGRRGESARGFVKHGSQSENQFKPMLAALWSLVVKPILDALPRACNLLVHELPHVTWCATGPLAFLPLHAAGLYDGSSPNAFDLVISSYTPSLSALLAPNTPETQPTGGVVAVSQEYTRGLCQLPNTVQEVETIKHHARTTRFLHLDGKNATANAVIKAMGEHCWVHLACHATQNQDNPAHSAFHLHNGNLTLEAITKRKFKNKGLAFLSACQTAKGDSKLPDESVHLAAGMLMAGYPSVIATMWSIADEDGPEVAGRVYAELLKDGKLNHQGAPRALHKAVTELREKIGVDLFERWVPFIHIGV